MAKKTKGGSVQHDKGKPSKTSAEQSPPRTLRNLKKVEEKLLGCLQEHAALLAETAEASPQRALEHLDGLGREGRAEQLLQRQPGQLTVTTITAILRELVSGERAAIGRQRVAFLGPLHSYSHLATIRRFGSSADLVPVGTIAAVFDEVEEEQVQWGVVPIENSSDGRIVDTLEMFTKRKVQICGEVPLRIHHNLLGSGSRDGIEEVCSKPQAISQCRDWLASHLPHARLCPTPSTTAAAERAANDKKVAAIASREAGVQYGLKVLGKNIEDKKNNITRFAVIGQQQAERSGNDKTSLMFELPHQPGALADAMAIFKRKSLNLTWIESFPKPNSPSEYLFFVELIGHPTDIRVRRALDLLEKKTVRLEVLGAYPLGG